MGAASSRLEKALGEQFPEGERYFGLENFGNTCYCNSVLQALYFCVPFREQLLEYYANNKSASDGEENMLTLPVLVFRAGDPLYDELWHACTGPLITVLRVGDLVFYFPQGHIKQAGQAPPSSPPRLILPPPCGFAQGGSSASVRAQNLLALLGFQVRFVKFSRCSHPGLPPPPVAGLRRGRHHHHHHGNEPSILQSSRGSSTATSRPLGPACGTSSMSAPASTPTPLSSSPSRTMRTPQAPLASTAATTATTSSSHTSSTTASRPSSPSAAAVIAPSIVWVGLVRSAS